jgi:hypothetical protein
MYKVKNITKGKLLLFDIGVKLNSGEVVDLDAILPREKIESSVNLKVAEDNELIAILHKDVVQAAPSTSFDPVMLLEMERRIREQIVQQMQTPVAQVPTPQVQNPNQDVAQLTAKLSELITKMNTGNNPTQTSEQVEDYTPDDDKLLEVHAKALKRMTQGASGHVEAKEQTSESQVSDRASELDDLLK